MKRSCLIFFAFISAFSLYGKEIEVCSSCEVKTIKEAVALSQDGDVILIKAGVYQEHDILVEKSIHIKGLNGSIVDGENKETIFRFSTDNFSVSGLEIINVGRSYTKDFAAILVSKSDGFIIENNVFKHVFFGILVEKSKNGLNYTTASLSDETAQRVAEAISNQYTISYGEYRGSLKEAVESTGQEWKGTHSIRWDYVRNNRDVDPALLSLSLGHSRFGVSSHYMKGI